MANLANCKRITKIFLSKIFSFEKFVLRKYMQYLYVRTRGWRCESIFKLKPTSKQPLSDPDGELSLKIPFSGQHVNKQTAGW